MQIDTSLAPAVHHSARNEASLSDAYAHCPVWKGQQGLEDLSISASPRLNVSRENNFSAGFYNRLFK
jgi:hypothetical protein